MPGNYTVTMVSGVPVVTAPPEIDSGNADALRTVILDTMAHGHATFVVDMTATGFCDSAGLHALLRAHRRARAEGGEARLVITSSAGDHQFCRAAHLRYHRCGPADTQLCHGAGSGGASPSRHRPATPPRQP